ncbi:hypothetical protein M3G71_18195, partial [Dietzia cercidiphylli]|nr:hypothetical protein [Dietzia cercidiphylli]
VVRAKTVCMAIADLAVVRAPDLLDRVFRSERPDRVWVADFTYVLPEAGFAHVTCVFDGFSHPIVARNASITWQRPRSQRKRGDGAHFSLIQANIVDRWQWAIRESSPPQS